MQRPLHKTLITSGFDLNMTSIANSDMEEIFYEVGSKTGSGWLTRKVD